MRILKKSYESHICELNVLGHHFEINYFSTSHILSTVIMLGI